MPSERFVSPPKWSRDELKATRDAREIAYREAWRTEGPGVVVEACRAFRPQVEGLLTATNDLRNIDGNVLIADPANWHLLRYVCAPVLSEENFWTLVGNPRSKKVALEFADGAAEVIARVVDPVRFPWVIEERAPTALERASAILATVVLLAAQKVGTGARGTASRRQEAAVAEVLTQAGFDRVESRKRIDLIDDLPRSSFSAERRVAGAKCEVPVRLRDGRLLAIECKVSIGPKNGWKRINRETGGKSQTWRNHFGAQVVTAVVIDGVFDLGCLTQAQDRQGVTIFWQHDLGPLRDFLMACS